MDYKSTNSLLRELIQSIINKGYSENQICYLLLGQQALAQYKNFLEDPSNNLGIKPLDRIFNNLGYDLLLVPVKKGDEYPEAFKEFWNSWYSIMEPCITEYIDNISKTPRVKPKKEIQLSKSAENIKDFLFDFINSQETQKV